MIRTTLLCLVVVVCLCASPVSSKADVADGAVDCLDIVAGILSAPCDLLGSCIGMFSPSQPYKVVCEKVKVPIKDKPRKKETKEIEPGTPVQVSSPEPAPKEEPPEVTVIVEPTPKPVDEKKPEPVVEKPREPEPKKPKKQEPTIYYFKAPCGPPPQVPGYFNPLYSP